MRARRYPCPDPVICRVENHDDLRNCKSVAKHLAPSTSRGKIRLLPPPATPNKEYARIDEYLERIIYEESGGCIENYVSHSGRTLGTPHDIEEWRVDGQLHRVGNPAYTESSCDGHEIVYVQYYVDGRPHRVDGPSAEEWHPGTRRKVLEEWARGGGYHREDGPAYQAWSVYGKPQKEMWYLNNKLHRVDGPASTLYSLYGKLDIERWYLSDELHREDGPAEIKYHPNGTDTVSRGWYLHGKRHREDGPALEGGGYPPDSYYLHGHPVQKQQFEQYQELRESGLSYEMALAWLNISSS